ncbi:MAG: efflux RND transporter periplasmic adaptor subunit [Patescibacteria group bacterium]|jgi:macrolide-specific efflux system membrane fusion protein
MLSFIKKHKLSFIMVLFLIVTFVFFGIIKTRAQNNRGFSLFNQNTQETIINPKRETITQELVLSGVIDASQKANVTFQTPGRLAWVGVKTGDRVRKWQSIASLDKAELRKNLERSFNDYKSALDTFEDTQQDYKDERDKLLLTDEMRRILSRSQNTLDNSVIAYELNDLAIKYATIWSPIDGIVTQAVPDVAGLNITPATTNYTIIDPNSLFFAAEIDQEDVNKVQTGQASTLELDSFEESLESEVTQISFSPLPNKASPTYEIRFQLNILNPDLKYRLGMTGDAKIVTAKSENTITIPFSALNEDNGQTYVFVKDEDNQTVRQDIKTGIESDNAIEVLEGLSENDQVVIQE